VYYSRPWLGLTPYGEEIEGEADFVLANPNLGVITLEIKGGGISYDPNADAWHSVDRYGIRHRIKNPFRQASNAKHEIIRRIREHQKWPSNRFIQARHGVVFPDVESPPADLAPDMPRELMLCRPRLPRVASWLRGRFGNGDGSALGPLGMTILDELLAKPFRLRMPLGYRVDDDDCEIEALTPDQFRILDALMPVPRVSIAGGAGTGKTLLALEEAVRHAELGRRVLLLSSGVGPVLYLRDRAQDSKIEVDDLQQLQERVPPDSNVAYDVIIIDEGQDLRTGQISALSQRLADTERGTFHVYYDCNQLVFGTIARELADIFPVNIPLRYNLRNTRAINDAAKVFYEGLALEPEGPPGADVVWEALSDGASTMEGLVTIARGLITERIREHDIHVLVMNEALEVNAAGTLTARGLGIQVHTVSDFKGLEAKVIILLATREMADQERLAYIALSRARSCLVVLGPPDILLWLKSGPKLRTLT
jgi:hypothetical protein